MTAATIAPAQRSTRIGHDLTGASTVQEAITRAGLDWGLVIHEAKNMSVTTDEGVILTDIPGQRLVMRDDNFVTMGVVGARYTSVDNRSVFSLGEHFLRQGATYTEGGERDHGRQVFMRMDLPGCNVQIAGGQDLIRGGVVLRASHDGSGKVVAGIEMTRLVCTNGMTAKIKGLPHLFKIAHTASAEARLAEASKVLQGAAQYTKGFAAACSHMLDTPMTTREFGRFIDGMWPKPEVEADGSTRALTIWENRRDALMDLFKFAETNELGRNTRMGAYNAITEWNDWGSNVRSASTASETEVRAVRRLELAGQETKDSALSLLSA